jgi:hypothetical protein
MDLTKIKWGNVEWIHLVQDKAQLRVVVHTVVKFWVPQNAGNLMSM